MPKFIKAFNRRDKTVVEMSSIAQNPRRAEIKVKSAMFIRRPGYVSAVENVDTMKITSGFFNEYRVMITIDPTEDIKSKLRINDVVNKVDEIL